MIIDFFTKLAERLKSENALSDVTWVLAETCQGFKTAFIKYFFPQIENPKLADIHQEYNFKEGVRPDLLIEIDDKKFLIENKIYDTNYHPEYKNIIGIDGLAIILNHKPSEGAIIEEFKVRRFWDDFIEYLEKQQSFDSEEKEFINGYIKYVKEVCTIMELKKITFNKLNSLIYFINLVATIIDKFQKEGLMCERNKDVRRSPFAASYSGQYFRLKRVGGKTTIWPSFGIYFGDEEPMVYIDFESDFCDNIYQQFVNKDKDIKNDIYHVVTNKEDGIVSFCLNKVKFDEFVQENTTLGQQKTILEEFFRAVIDEIEKFL